jgi:hypothetical protein
VAGTVRAEDVFAYVGDPAHWPEFETDFAAIEPANGTTRQAGSLYRYARKIPGKVINGTFRITEYEPAVSMLMEVDDWVGPIKSAGGYRLSTARERLSKWRSGSPSAVRSRYSHRCSHSHFAAPAGQFCATSTSAG